MHCNGLSYYYKCIHCIHTTTEFKSNSPGVCFSLGAYRRFLKPLHTDPLAIGEHSYVTWYAIVILILLGDLFLTQFKPLITS